MSAREAREVVLAVDQGTTNSKAVLVDDDGRVRSTGAAPVGLSTPEPGWVEQDPERLWSSVLDAVSACLAGSRDRVVGLALSTQRETVVGWGAADGKAVGPALGWQDQRTAAWCAAHLGAEDDALVRARTGLRVDPMFSAPKMAWLLAQPSTPADVVLGTVDAWLVHRLTAGATRACEAGNASRTLLYDVSTLSWSPPLLDLFGVPASALPEVRPSDAGFGATSGVPGLQDGLPVLAVLADSHAALLGQGCTTPGTAKATYGTGTSVMAPVDAPGDGRSPVPTTLAWLTAAPVYAREGNIVSSGAALTWTATLLGLDVSGLLALAGTVPDAGGVTLVPAFNGLGAPRWDRARTASLSGLTSSSTRAHVARAAVDAVAHQVCDVVDVIRAEGVAVDVLRADGGASASALLMQTQADLLGIPVEVSPTPEVSALGVARLAWESLGHPTSSVARPARRVDPAPGSRAEERRARWRSAIDG